MSEFASGARREEVMVSKAAISGYDAVALDDMLSALPWDFPSVQAMADDEVDTVLRGVGRLTLAAYSAFVEARLHVDWTVMPSATTLHHLARAVVAAQRSNGGLDGLGNLGG